MDGKLYPIPNPEVMNWLFNTWDHKEVQRLTLPIGKPLYNGRLVKNANYELYLMADDLKIFIANEKQTMFACNFKWDNIEKQF